jgi:hypothetical protein
MSDPAAATAAPSSEPENDTLQVDFLSEDAVLWLLLLMSADDCELKDAFSLEFFELDLTSGATGGMLLWCLMAASAHSSKASLTSLS